MTLHNGPAFRPSLGWDEATRRWLIVNTTMPIKVLPSFGLRFRF